MDFGKCSLEEMRQGYAFEKKTQSYKCILCHEQYYEGQFYPIEEKFFDAKHAMLAHVKSSHHGTMASLLKSDSRYNTFTDHQKELLEMFAKQYTDEEIAKHFHVSASTIRHQKFTFREKAKQARMYLAVYEQVFEQGDIKQSMVAIHDHATMVDDRYTTEDEKEHILQTCFDSLQPLKLSSFHWKQKKKVIILSRIVEEFIYDRTYTEKEVTDVLKMIYDDAVLLRRYLIEYGFLKRNKDGSAYWRT